ncbi:MAG: hypothetical protein WCP53_15500 [Verrucomicrobiota bacterium]
MTCAFVAFSPALSAHDAGGGHPKDTAVTAVPLPFVVEKTGPVRAPKAVKLEPGTKVSGQGFWKFIAAPDLVPVPPAAVPFVKGAHGTVIFDAKNDSVSHARDAASKSAGRDDARGGFVASVIGSG